jgi:hypothetical protein
MEWDGCGPGLDVVRIVASRPAGCSVRRFHVSHQQISELEAKPVDRTGAVLGDLTVGPRRGVSMPRPDQTQQSPLSSRRPTQEPGRFAGRGETELEISR